MRILYVGMKYDYGRPELGPSFEHNTFFDSLRRMGNDILYFDFASVLKSRGRAGMNRRLLEVARQEHPDLLFAVLFREELERDIVREISESTDTTTLNWFCDDHWRFESYSRLWAPCFNWVVTTAASALPKYQAIGYDRVIKSQWACNHYQYKPLGLVKEYDATFVGFPHGDRRAVIQTLRKSGLNVDVWGRGWATGRVSNEDMIRIFDQSRINLNLANSSFPTSRIARLVAAFNLLVEAAPVAPQRRDTIANWLVEIAVGHVGQSTRTMAQIKGRNFEVPGCGGFLLTGEAENLGEYYVPGKEIVTFTTPESLSDQIRYFLAHQQERDTIAAAGYARTLRDHTYAHRFAQIFKRIGVEIGSLDDLVQERRPPGQTKDIL